MTHNAAFPDWVSELMPRAVSVLALPDNWDSYGAPPIAPERMAGALGLLYLVMPDNAPCPAITPTSDGGLLFEWHMRGLDIELSPISATRYSLYWRDLTSGLDNEIEGSGDLTPLIDVLRKLASRE